MNDNELMDRVWDIFSDYIPDSMRQVCAEELMYLFETGGLEVDHDSNVGSVASQVNNVKV